MPGLHEIQAGLREALLGGNEDAVAVHIRSDGLSVRRRLGIYRNNVFSNQRAALRTLYPVVERLVGPDFFGQVADEYIRCHASPSGDLNRFGAHFPEFLAVYPPALALVYLADTARLEALAHRVYHAAGHPGLDLQRLAAVPAERYGNLCFVLHPATELLASPYPVHRIWQVNQPDYEGDQSVDLNAGAVRLLIVCRAGRVELLMLGVGEWTLLRALADRQRFAAACDAALAAQPDLDLDATIPHLIAQATIVDFDLPQP